MKRRLAHWWLGAHAAALQGGAMALKAWLALAGASAAHLVEQPLDLKGAFWIFAGAALYHFADFISTHPMPIEQPIPTA